MSDEIIKRLRGTPPGFAGLHHDVRLHEAADVIEQQDARIAALEKENAELRAKDAGAQSLFVKLEAQIAARDAVVDAARALVTLGLTCPPGCACEASASCARLVDALDRLDARKGGNLTRIEPPPPEPDYIEVYFGASGGHAIAHAVGVRAVAAAAREYERELIARERELARAPEPDYAPNAYDDTRPVGHQHWNGLPPQVRDRFRAFGEAVAKRARTYERTGR